MSEARADVGHDHPGGASRRAYQQGCRHPDCVDANAGYKRDRARARSRPDTAWLPLVPAGPARRQVESLVVSGWSLAQIALAAGIGRGTLTRLRARETRRVTVTVADALGALAPKVGDRPSVAETAAAVTHVVTADRPPFDPAASWPPPLGSWQMRSACGGLSRSQAAVFFPTRGDDTRTAKGICELCPVEEQCRAYALDHDVVGVWGGTTAEERRRMRASRAAPGLASEPMAKGSATGTGNTSSTVGRVVTTTVTAGVLGGDGGTTNSAVAAGGKPSKGTPADRRLKENKGS